MCLRTTRVLWRPPVSLSGCAVSSSQKPLGKFVSDVEVANVLFIKTLGFRFEEVHKMCLQALRVQEILGLTLRPSRERSLKGPVRHPSSQKYFSFHPGGVWQVMSKCAILE